MLLIPKMKSQVLTAMQKLTWNLLSDVYDFTLPSLQPIVIGHEEAEFTRRQVGSDQALAFQASVYFDTIARLDKGAWKE